MAESAVVLPEVATGTATIDPAEAQGIDDGGLPGANFADWTITPPATGELTVNVSVTEGEMTIDGGAGDGSRDYMVANAAGRSARVSPGIGLGP
jgi:hypothetical protein